MKQVQEMKSRPYVAWSIFAQMLSEMDDAQLRIVQALAGREQSNRRWREIREGQPELFPARSEVKP